MDVPLAQVNDTNVYKLYKRRFAGLFGIVCHVFLRDAIPQPVNGRFTIGPVEHPEPRQCHGLALVRSNCKLEYAHPSSYTPSRKVFD